MKKFLLFTLIFGLGFSSSQSVNGGNPSLASMTPDEMRAALEAMKDLTEDWVVVDPTSLQTRTSPLSSRSTPPPMPNDEKDISDDERENPGLTQSSQDTWYSLAQNPQALIKVYLNDLKKEYSILDVRMKNIRDEINKLKKRPSKNSRDRIKELKRIKEEIKARRALLRKKIEREEEQSSKSLNDLQDLLNEAIQE